MKNLIHWVFNFWIFCACKHLHISMTIQCIPLTNQVPELYCKLQTKFFPLIYNPSAKCIGYKTKGKNQGSAIYSMDWEDEVRMIFITSLLCVWRIWGTISIHTKGLKISEAPRKQSKSIWNCCETLKSLASFDTQSQE